MTISARDRLLDAAAALFYDEGITATGVDTIARRAGVTKPTLYAQFGSKTGLVAAVLHQRHERRVTDLAARLADVPADQQLIEVFQWLADWYVRDGARGCGFVNAAAELPDPEDPGRHAAQAEKRWLADTLERLSVQAHAQRPDELASQMLLLLDGVAARVVVHGHQQAAPAVAAATSAARTLIAAGRTA
jgi:AcrR family transcriptional regulator